MQFLKLSVTNEGIACFFPFQIHFKVVHNLKEENYCGDKITNISLSTNFNCYFPLHQGFIPYGIFLGKVFNKAEKISYFEFLYSLPKFLLYLSCFIFVNIFY